MLCWLLLLRFGLNGKGGFTFLETLKWKMKTFTSEGKNKIWKSYIFVSKDLEPWKVYFLGKKGEKQTKEARKRKVENLHVPLKRKG